MFKLVYNVSETYLVSGSQIVGLAQGDFGLLELSVEDSEDPPDF